MARTKRDRLRDRNLLRFIRDPHYLNCFSTLMQRLLYSSEVGCRGYGSGINKDTERFIPSLENGFSEAIKKEDWKEPLEFLEIPSLGIRSIL